MTFRRLAAIALIFLGTSLAWTVLGSSLVARSGEFDGRLEREVQLLWGRPHRQIAPNAWILRPSIETVVEETKDQQGRTLRKQVSKTVLQAGARAARIDARHRRPRPGTSTQGPAVVCHLHRHVQRVVHVPQPGCRGARTSRASSAARRGRPLRRLRVHGGRPYSRARGRRLERDDGRRECRAGRGRHPRRPVPIERARHLDLRVCRDRRRAGARLQSDAADKFPGHRLPRRDASRRAR